MIVIPPVTITAAMVTSSIAEPSTGETLWNPATSYAAPTRVYRAETHKIYESSSVVGTIDSVVPELSIYTTAPKWVEVSSTNKYAMFDTLRNVKSYATNSIVVVLKPTQRIDALALLGLENVSRITVTTSYGTVPATTIVDKDNSYTVNGTTSYYASCITLDIPPYYNVTITITLTGTGTIKCGNIVAGIYQNIGIIQKGIAADAVNFSTVERDLYGNATLIQRRNIPKISATLIADKSIINKVGRLREYLNAKPAVWSGLDQSVSDTYYESLLILGFYKTFTINIDNPIAITINLELEEI
jgi:hypothetical protein